jgi:hypothetical protein
MQHHLSLNQDSAVAAIAVLNVVKDQKPVKKSESIHLHVVPAKAKYSKAIKIYNPSRRYTIDDNGGSYEGL